MHGLRKRVGNRRIDRHIESLHELGLDLVLRRRITDICIEQARQSPKWQVNEAMALHAYQTAKQERAKEERAQAKRKAARRRRTKVPAPEGNASTVSPASSVCPWEDDAKEGQEEEVNDAPIDDDDDDDEGQQEEGSNCEPNDTVPQPSPSPTQNSLPPDQLAIPDRLFLRCTRRYGWSDETCQCILVAYREFMELKRQRNDWNATVLVPPTEDVDRMWHEHILDVQHYVKACDDYCGNLIGYDPDAVLNRAAYDSSGNCHNNDHKRRRVLSEEQPSNYQQPQPSKTGRETITITIGDPTGEETYYKIRQSVQMKKLFEAHAGRQGVSREQLSFLLRGIRIEEYETPMTLELEDQEQIECIMDEEHAFC